jgi:hypothetical protein
LTGPRASSIRPVRSNAVVPSLTQHFQLALVTGWLARQSMAAWDPGPGLAAQAAARLTRSPPKPSGWRPAIMHDWRLRVGTVRRDDMMITSLSAPCRSTRRVSPSLSAAGRNWCSGTPDSDGPGRRLSASAGPAAMPFGLGSRRLHLNGWLPRRARDPDHYPRSNSESSQKREG